jgi:hypothetical protein
MLQAYVLSLGWVVGRLDHGCKKLLHDEFDQSYCFRENIAQNEVGPMVCN